MRAYDFGNNRPSSRIKPKKKNGRYIGLVFVVSLILIGVLAQYVLHKDTTVAKKQTLAMKSEPSSTPTEMPQNSQPLGDVVQSAIGNADGNYSVVVRNLKTKEFYNYQENKTYESGSLYKLWVMAVAYQQLQSGQIKETDILSDDVEDLNDKFDIASDSADLQSGTVTFPVNQALQQMITISHNYAALLLTQKVKLSNLAMFLQTNNFNNSTVAAPPKTTAADIADFLEDLYDGQFANAQGTQAMIDLLKAQKLNNKLPRELPETTQIAHKTGELGTYSHDAGIVYTQDGDYIIVVMTNTKVPSTAEDKIADISKAVYDYFQKS